MVEPREVLDLLEELVVLSDLKEELEDWDQDRPQEVAVTSTKPIESSRESWHIVAFIALSPFFLNCTSKCAEIPSNNAVLS